jgi:hypothetical protein
LREEVTRGWRKLYIEDLAISTPPTIIRMITSRRMIWAGPVAFMQGLRNLYRILTKEI